MALSFETYIQYGAQALYPIPFPYLSRSHVKVFFDGVETTDFTFETDSTIRLATPPPGGTEVSIKRKTDSASRLIDFQDGSTLTEKDLDTDSNQMFYLCQEAADRADQSITLVGGVYDAQGLRIANVGDPVGDMDAVNERTLGARYPDILKVAPYVTAIETVAKDLTSLSLYELDLGSVASPPSYNAGGSLGSIKVCAENMTYIQALGGSAGDMQAISPHVAAIETCAANISEITEVAAAASIVAENANSAATSASQAASSATQAHVSEQEAATSAQEAAQSAIQAAASVGSVSDGAVTSQKLAPTLDLGAL